MIIHNAFIDLLVVSCYNTPKVVINVICEFIPILYGHSMLPESMAFVNGSKRRFVPIDLIIYYIRTESKQILVDAGCDTMPGFEIRDFIGPVKALNNCGINENDITDIIITHAHHDHIDGVKHFKNATIHIQKDEYESGKKYIPQTAVVNLVDEEFSLCKEISIIKFGGHSLGSCIVKIQIDNKKYVICGDECYVRKCLDEKIPTGVSVCPSKSKDFVDIFADSENIMLLCHEWSDIGSE